MQDGRCSIGTPLQAAVAEEVAEKERLEAEAARREVPRELGLCCMDRLLLCNSHGSHQADREAKEADEAEARAKVTAQGTGLPRIHGQTSPRCRALGAGPRSPRGPARSHNTHILALCIPSLLHHL